MQDVKKIVRWLTFIALLAICINGLFRIKRAQEDLTQINPIGTSGFCDSQESRNGQPITKIFRCP